MPVVSVDVKVIPMVHSQDVFTIISDSGITRVRMKTKVWDVYSNGGDQYWYFPKKIYAEQLDSLFHVESSILADTAYYYEKKQLWHAIGNVVATNSEGRRFETSELFWNQKVPEKAMNAFYTQKPVKIIEPDSTITLGLTGFTADQSLNIIRLFSVKANLLVDESDTIQRNTVGSDSIKQHQ